MFTSHIRHNRTADRDGVRQNRPGKTAGPRKRYIRCFRHLSKRNGFIPETHQFLELSPFLDHVHQKKGVDCLGCHGMKRPPLKANVPSQRCISCHALEEIQAQTQDSDSGFNPHRPHHYGMECTGCHHAHSRSKMSCNKCHIRHDMRY